MSSVKVFAYKVHDSERGEAVYHARLATKSYIEHLPERMIDEDYWTEVDEETIDFIIGDMGLSNVIYAGSQPVYPPLKRGYVDQ
jgi:hypothetical protein